DRGDVIHAVNVGIEHRVGTMFGDLLHSAVEVSNDAFGAKNFFAVEAENHAQHAVGGGMLRAHIYDEFVGIKKCLVGLAQFEMGDVLLGGFVGLHLVHLDPVGHWPLSMPRLIWTHSWSCWMIP